MAKQRIAVPVLLLLVTLVGVAALLGLLGGAVLLPQAGLFVWIALGFAVFLGSQLVIFRMLGLRARADDEPGDDASDPAADAASLDAAPGADQPPAEPDDSSAQDADWRAWRG